MNLFKKQDLERFYAEDVKSRLTKNCKGVAIIKPDDFRDDRKLQEKSNGKTIIVNKATNLKQADEKYREKNPDEDYLCIKEPDWKEEKYYRVCHTDDKPACIHTRGYIAVSDTEFIEVYGHWAVLLWLLFGLGVALILALKFGWVSTPDEDTKNPLKEDDSQTSWNGELPNVNGDVPEQENIEIPGFYRFTATSEAGSVPLYNPESNTVYFQYNIYEIVNSTEVGIYGTASEAQEYIQANSVEYSLKKDDGFYLVDESGNRIDTVTSYKSVPSGDTYTVVEEELKAIYATDMVSPGNQVLWHAYESLGVGDYMLKFVISTYDIETGGECYGAVQTVEAIVK